MRTGNDRVQVVGEQVCVTIGAAVVEPGDILRGDSDGMIVISKDREEEILVVAEGIDRAEQEIRAQLTIGSRLDAAREKSGYHRLQKPDGNTNN